ncbi:hypothetical protein [Bradyrhizobium sp. Tv2a-2]|uniref:hypothetical protein n=1 Tax=Bradyrhizobium sp. Tv2a-2 TaxID=113395 RepID=UPI0004668EEB|nr:hypothetical protein [Bradyrhizobium sp. Tv2a-2]
MRRVIATALAGACALAGASLGGCSSTSFSDYFKSKPPNIQVQLESQPSGADAKTSLGPGCKTPCSVSVPAPDASFTVTYALAKYQPATVTVAVVKNPGDLTTSATTTTDPNPVFAELQPAGPPPKARKMHPKTKPKLAAPADSAFPDSNAAPPPGSR